MKPTEEQIESVAKMFAAAYWRGRLAEIASNVTTRKTIEAMVEAAAEADKEYWKGSARVALS